MHAPLLCPGSLWEATPFNRKAYAFADDVGSGTAPLVEFLEDAFKATGLLHAHGKWANFDLEIINDCVEFSVIPLTGRQTHRVPKMIWVPPCCVTLLIGCHLTPRQFCAMSSMWCNVTPRWFKTSMCIGLVGASRLAPSKVQVMLTRLSSWMVMLWLP